MGGCAELHFCPPSFFSYYSPLSNEANFEKREKNKKLSECVQLPNRENKIFSGPSKKKYCFLVRLAKVDATTRVSMLLTFLPAQCLVAASRPHFTGVSHSTSSPSQPVDRKRELTSSFFLVHSRRKKEKKRAKEAHKLSSHEGLQTNQQ